MFIWLRSTLPQFASYLSSFKTDPNQEYIDALKNGTADDMYSGLYKAIKAKIIEINTDATTTTTTTKEA
ncbi:hypothetical protein IMAU80057_03364 [Lactiplantibacillus plantarum]|nr:hypothetical protein [Lactiplantibacillus plantarum]